MYFSYKITFLNINMINITKKKKDLHTKHVDLQRKNEIFTIEISIAYVDVYPGY